MILDSFNYDFTSFLNINHKQSTVSRGRRDVERFFIESCPYFIAPWASFDLFGLRCGILVHMDVFWLFHLYPQRLPTQRHILLGYADLLSNSDFRLLQTAKLAFTVLPKSVMTGLLGLALLFTHLLQIVHMPTHLLIEIFHRTESVFLSSSPVSAHKTGKLKFFTLRFCLRIC